MRYKAAKLAYELRGCHTPSLTIREKNRAIRANIRVYKRNLMTNLPIALLEDVRRLSYDQLITLMLRIASIIEARKRSIRIEGMPK